MPYFLLFLGIFDDSFEMGNKLCEFSCINGLSGMLVFSMGLKGCFYTGVKCWY